MEQFKAKLIEVEECRTKIAQIETAKLAAKQCLHKNKVYYNEHTFET
jgi:ribosomal protein L16/L10AE